MLCELEDAPELKILDLSWNMIRDFDIRPICNGLKVIEFDIPTFLYKYIRYQSKNNPSLERLDLMMNGLGNQGTIIIANMLSMNETLTELDLSNNRIEKDGADIFASKLEMNRKLKKLWVNCRVDYILIPKNDPII